MSKSSSNSKVFKSARITKETLNHTTELVCKRDHDLNQIVKKYGFPPLWSRQANFSTLVQIILEQQVSLSSAQATFTKLKSVVSPITPEKILNLTPADLRRLGFTRQKASYCLGLAESIVNKDVSLRNIAKLDPNSARGALETIRGIGPWSADIYLLMALRHPDIWPQGDLALTTAIYHVKRLRKKPTTAQLDRITSNWRPFRSVAARLLWHFYLSDKKR